MRSRRWVPTIVLVLGLLAYLGSHSLLPRHGALQPDPPEPAGVQDAERGAPPPAPDAPSEREEQAPGRSALPKAAEVPRARSTTALRLRTRFASGESTPFVRLELRSHDREAPGTWHETDAAGELVVRGLRAGSDTLQADRGTHVQAQVLELGFDRPLESLAPADREQLEALTTLQVVLELEEGFDLGGRVVDRDGIGVAGAPVWISTGASRRTGTIAAHTAPDGSFVLRQLHPSCLVGARAEGHAPSASVWIESMLAERQGEEPLQCELVLLGPDARVEGRVLDADGRPIEGARVRLGAQDHFEPYDGHAAPPPPLEVLTDATGRFHAGSLAPGRVDVAARASGGAVQVGTIDVGPDESAWIELRLEPPVRVHGRVLDEEGRPVAHVVVRSAQGRLNTPRVRSSFREPSDQTDGEGSFALEELCAGELSISARHPDGRSARTTLQLAPGSSAECTLVLEHEPSIHGRALSSHGSPLAGWTVRAEPMQPGGPPPRAVFTRADGSFELRFPTRGRVRLELLAPEVRRDDPPRAALDDIEVGARDLLLHANF